MREGYDPASHPLAFTDMTDLVVARHFLGTQIANLNDKLRDRRYGQARKAQFLAEIRDLNAQLRALV